MKTNVDAQIYCKKIVDYFDNNPDQLHTLIGDMDKKKFYSKIEKKVQENISSGDEYELNKKELADIIFELFTETHRDKQPKIEIDAKFIETNFGYFSLN